MEIERKYLVNEIPFSLDEFPHRTIEQGYLSIDPVIRIRKDGEEYVLTYKSKGLMIREEYNMPLTRSSYEHLQAKIDGILIHKERYCIPHKDGLTIELDIFKDTLAPLMLAEVEFQNETSANVFTPPAWFGEDVTFTGKYQNSALCMKI